MPAVSLCTTLELLNVVVLFARVPCQERQNLCCWSAFLLSPRPAVQDGKTMQSMAQRKALAAASSLSSRLVA